MWLFYIFAERVKYNLTNILIFFGPVMKVKHLNNCKVVFDFKQMELFRISQGMCRLGGIMWYALLGEGVLILNAWAILCWLLFLLGLLFTQKTNQRQNIYSWMQLIKYPPPQFYHDINCCNKCRGSEGEESDQDKNWGGVCCKVKGWK